MRASFPTIRERSSTPILMITAKDAFEDMRQGFLSGTDDYMVKPINVNEMVMRVQALLRRAQMINERKQVIGGTTLEYDTYGTGRDRTATEGVSCIIQDGILCR